MNPQPLKSAAITRQLLVSRRHSSAAMTQLLVSRRHSSAAMTQLLVSRRHSSAVSNSGHCKPNWYNSTIRVFLRLFLVGACLAQSKDDAVQKDLQALASALPGCYSNAQQYHRHAQRGVPPNRRSFLIRSEMLRVSPAMFNDSLTIYFQDFTKSASQPFRSGFYSFVFDYSMNVFRMRTIKLKTDFLKLDSTHVTRGYVIPTEDVQRALQSHNMSVSELLSYRACDMFWKRIGERTFVGITGPQCLGALGKEQVRIGVSMTLTDDKLVLTEGWYNLKDGTSISEVKIPYHLQKIKSKDVASSDVTLYSDSPSPGKPKARPAFKTKSMDTQSDSTPRRRSRDFYSRSHEPGQEDVSLNGRNSDKILGTFSQLAAALTAGYDVRFRVELSACTVPAQIKLDRLSFGGKIKDFVYIRQDGAKNERNDYIYSVTRTTVMGPQGSQYISRELTFLRGGRVKVKVVKSYPDPAKLGKEYSFDCRLFDEQQGYGGVKMTLDSRSRHHRVSGYRSLTLAVDQGHDLNVIVDLNRCEGSRKKPAIVIGSQITDYDVVNGGKTLEVFLQLPAMSGGQRVQGEGFIAQFLKNGDVAIMKIGSPNPVLIDQLPVGPAFNCKLSNQNAVHTNNVDEASVKVFFNK